MLKKVLNITNIGRYKSFGSRDDSLSFKKNTFIYGKNTKGKSTFSSILKSLAIQNPDLIIGRKTFGATTNQQVTFEMGGGNILFQNNNWNNTYNIKIFDNQYVYENIYSDEIMDSTKQEQIANIILGENGRRLEIEYNETKRLCDENTQLKRSLALEYGRILGTSILSFEEFRGLQSDPTLDYQIKLIQDELDAYKNQILIKETIESFLSEIRITVNKLDLEKTLEIESQVIEQHIQKNISGRGGDEILKFLEVGTNSLLDGDDINCTYCGQDINNKNTKILIESYKVLFSEQYQKLNNEIKKVIIIFKQINLGLKIGNFEKKLSQLGIDFEIENKEKIHNCLIMFLSELEKKQDNLNYEINFQAFDDLEYFLNLIHTKSNPILVKYNNPIDNNTKLQKENELKKLLLIKERFTATWLAKCDEYNLLQDNFNITLKPAEERSFTAKVEYAQTILSGYEYSINLILTKLSAGFELCEFQVPENRRAELKLFGIKFGDHKVELHGTENIYHFKNTLSDSDKRLLAFAFFIVDIQKTQNLDNYIVVFDDPMSSLDIDRKKMTIESIRDCLTSEEGKIPSQIIILTHEDNFFHIVYNTYKSIPDSTFLKIDYNAGNSSSEIQICNVEDEFIKTKHIKDLEKFQKYINGQVNGSSLNDIRIGLEFIIKTKYYLDIPGPVIQSGGVVSWYINNKCTGNQQKIQRINDIYPHQMHHDQTGCGIAEEDLAENEKRDIVSKYLDLIQEI